MLIALSVTILIILAICLIYLFYFHWSVSVPDYMAARHYRFRKPTTEGPISGKRIVVIPSIDQVVMIDKRIQKSTIENISVLTRERQVMSLSVTLIWKPTNAAMTIENIRPEDIEPTFFKIAESVIKDESSKMNVDEILENRNILSKNLLKFLSETTDTWGITVSSINISNLVVVNESFMKNMAMPKEIELERKTRLAQIEKELAVELSSIEKTKEAELSKLESEKVVGIKREEINTTLETAKKDREILISDMEARLERIKSEILLIQSNCTTTSEAQRIKATILAETEGLREKLKVINSCSSSAISFEVSKMLPGIYKNIKMGDITLFEGSNLQNGGTDFSSYVAASALSLMKKISSNVDETQAAEADSTAVTAVE